MATFSWPEVEAAIRAAQFYAHQVMVAKGFHSLEVYSKNTQEMLNLARLGLVCSEAAEAMEEVRHPGAAIKLSQIRTVKDSAGNDKPEGFAVELADIVLRVFDIAQANGVDLAAAIRLKCEYNRTRGHKHGRLA